MEKKSGQRAAGRQPNLGGCQGSSQGSETVEDDCLGPMLHKERRGLSQVSQSVLMEMWLVQHVRPKRTLTKRRPPPQATENKFSVSRRSLWTSWTKFWTKITNDFRQMKNSALDGLIYVSGWVFSVFDGLQMSVCPSITDILWLNGEKQDQGWY